MTKTGVTLLKTMIMDKISIVRWVYPPAMCGKIIKLRLIYMVGKPTLQNLFGRLNALLPPQM
jgi:hypothetical protein